MWPDLLSKRASGSRGGSVAGLSLAGPLTLISALPIAIRSTGKFIYSSFLLLCYEFLYSRQSLVQVATMT